MRYFNGSKKDLLKNERMVYEETIMVGLPYGCINFVHTDDEKKEKIQALINAIKELRFEPEPELNHKLDSLKEQAALNGLNIPILNAVGRKEND